MNQQLPLSVGLKDSATFDSYLPGPNMQAVDYLQRVIGKRKESAIYLWGEPGTGKSHLLQATCHAAGAAGLAAMYLPLHTAEQFSCDALDGIEKMDMVCIDDVHAIGGQHDWERALVRLFERIYEAGGGLVITGKTIVAELDIQLPQLTSRLAWGLTFQLQPLDETAMLEALQLRASRRGFTLPPATARYLIRYCSHDMCHLFNALDSLDHASLVAKRKLTIPFVRSVLTANAGEP